MRRLRLWGAPIEFDGFLELRDRCLAVAALHLRLAYVEIPFRAFGPELDGFRKFALRRAELPLFKVNHSQIKMARKVARIARNFSFEFTARVRQGRVTSLEQINPAQIGVRACSLRIQLERLAILCNGKVKPPGLLIGASNKHVQLRGRSERSKHFVEDIRRVRQLI